MKNFVFLFAFLLLSAIAFSQTSDTIIVTTTTSTGGFVVNEGSYPAKYFHHLTYESHPIKRADSLGFVLYNTFGRKVTAVYPYDKWRIDGYSYLNDSTLQVKFDSIFVNFK